MYGRTAVRPYDLLITYYLLLITYYLLLITYYLLLITYYLLLITYYLLLITYYLLLITYYLSLQPHLKIAAPQVKPAPKPEAAIVSPGLTLPSAIAASKARGIEAAEVLPYSAILLKIFDWGILRRLATASIMR